MTVAADLVQECRRLLNAGLRQEMNLLALPLDDSAATVALSNDVAGAQAGAYLAVGLEVMYVWSAATSAKTVTVQRGMLGSTPAAHAANSLVFVNPRFTDFDVFTALNHDLTDLSSPSNGLFRVGTLDLIPVAGRAAYDLTGAEDLIEPLDLSFRHPSATYERWESVPGISVLRGMPRTDFPSGVALNVPRTLPAYGEPVRLRYKASFCPFTDLTSDVGDTGLPETAYDLPPLGAALRVSAGLPVRRTQTDAQGDTRRATEVSTNDLLQAPAVLRQQRAQRIAAERARLSAAWPPTRNR